MVTRRNYLVALITVDTDASEAFLSHSEHVGTQDERLHHHIQGCMNAVNAALHLDIRPSKNLRYCLKELRLSVEN